MSQVYSPANSSPNWSTAATAGSSSPPTSRRVSSISFLNLGQPLLSPLAPTTPGAITLTRQRKHLRGKPRQSACLEVFSNVFLPSAAWVQYLREEESVNARWEALVKDGKEAGRSLRKKGEGEGEGIEEPGDAESIRLEDAEVPGNDKEAVRKEENKLHARWGVCPSPRTSGTSRSEGLGGAEDSQGDEKEDFGSRRSSEAPLVENRAGVRRTGRIGVVEANQMCLHSYLRKI